MKWTLVFIGFNDDYIVRSPLFREEDVNLIKAIAFYIKL